MADYLVGIIAKLADSALAKFMFQSSNLKVASDKYTAKNEKGNTARVQYKDHRCTCDVDAIIPARVGVPVPGQIVTLTGMTLPTVNEDGEITSGEFKIDPTATSRIEFKIDSEANISQQNTDFIHCSFSGERFLVKGIPNSQDSDSDND